MNHFLNGLKWYLGSALDINTFKESYVRKKVSKWIDDIVELSDEPYEILQGCIFLEIFLVRTAWAFPRKSPRKNS